MEAFYKITILVMIVFLILILTVIGILMAKKSNNLVYPPVANQCPDFWTFDGSNCIVPNKGVYKNGDTTIYKDDPDANNVLNGLSSVTVINSENTPGFKVERKNNQAQLKINFNDSGWAGTCGQKQWANKNNIVWDGISNYNTCASST